MFFVQRNAEGAIIVVFPPAPGCLPPCGVSVCRPHRGQPLSNRASSTHHCTHFIHSYHAHHNHRSTGINHTRISCYVIGGGYLEPVYCTLTRIRCNPIFWSANKVAWLRSPPLRDHHSISTLMYKLVLFYHLDIYN